MRLWLRGLACQALRSSWGVCRIHTQPPPPPIPEVVATWEAISLGRQPVPEYFNFAHDAMDNQKQLSSVAIQETRQSSLDLWGKQAHLTMCRL
uniref:Acyl-CoA synthetase medium-chain family member 5 n=1 Tax=Mus musculus TaxID=10090 RepID=A0A140LI83_MOUSE